MKKISLLFCLLLSGIGFAQVQPGGPNIPVASGTANTSVVNASIDQSTKMLTINAFYCVGADQQLQLNWEPCEQDDPISCTGHLVVTPADDTPDPNAACELSPLKYDMSSMQSNTELFVFGEDESLVDVYIQ